MTNISTRVSLDALAERDGDVLAEREAVQGSAERRARATTPTTMNGAVCQKIGM